MAKVIIGVMGPGDSARPQDMELAKELGQKIAGHGWILLTGGRDVGVMHAASKGAQQAGGLTIGVLPMRNRKGASSYVDIPICTGMGSARNNINVLSSDVVIACGSGAGTLSEIMLALKAGKPVILIHQHEAVITMLNGFNYSFHIAETATEVITLVDTLL